MDRRPSQQALPCNRDAEAIIEWLGARLLEEREAVHFAAQRRHRALVKELGHLLGDHSLGAAQRLDDSSASYCSQAVPIAEAAGPFGSCAGDFHRQAASSKIPTAQSDNDEDEDAAECSSNSGTAALRHRSREMSRTQERICEEEQHQDRVQCALPVLAPRLVPIALHAAPPAPESAEPTQYSTVSTGLTNGDGGASASTVKDSRFASLSDTLESEPHTAYGRFERFVKSSEFELVCLIFVAVNTGLLAGQQQYAGWHSGYTIGYEGYPRPAEEQFPGMKDLLDVGEKVFCVVFTIELVLRMLAWRLDYFRHFWNYLDIVVVGMSLMAWCVPETVAEAGDLSFARMARFGRIFRILGKTRRNSSKFESLFSILGAIAGCTNVLFWSLVIICVVQCIAGMAIGVFIEPFLEKDLSTETRHLVFTYYGTWWRSMVTMFEVSLANWAPACRILFEHVHQGFSYFFLFYRCVVGFAVLSVIQAVFIQQTMKAFHAEQQTLINRARMEREAEARKLKKVFEAGDASGDGRLDWDEFQALMKDDHSKASLDILDLDMGDIRTVFELMSDGSGSIAWDDLVSRLHHIKGEARSLDVVTLLASMRRIEAKLDWVV